MIIEGHQKSGSWDYIKESIEDSTKSVIMTTTRLHRLLKNSTVLLQAVEDNYKQDPNSPLLSTSSVPDEHIVFHFQKNSRHVECA